MRPILTNSLIKPNSSQIVSTLTYATEMMAIRKDTTLFRLRSGQDVASRLSFYNTGSNQVAGVIAMSINGQQPSAYDGAKYKNVVVLFNVDKVAQSVTIDALKGKTLSIHPIQQASTVDTLAKTATYSTANGAFTIPARTTVVFIE